MPIGYFPRNNRAGELLGQGLSAFGQNFMAARQNRDERKIRDEDRARATALQDYELGQRGVHLTKPGELPPSSVFENITNDAVRAGTSGRSALMPGDQAPGSVRPSAGFDERAPQSEFQRLLASAMPSGNVPARPRYEFGNGFYVDNEVPAANAARASAAEGQSAFQKALLGALPGVMTKEMDRGRTRDANRRAGVPENMLDATVENPQLTDNFLFPKGSTQPKEEKIRARIQELSKTMPLDAANKQARLEYGEQNSQDPSVRFGLQSMTRALSLKSQYDADPTVKDAAEVANAYNAIKTLGKDATGASDIRLLYAYMKLLDPGSVVRESEFATAAKSGSLPENIQAYAGKVVNGQRLTPDQRKAFIQEAERQAVSRRQMLAGVNKRYSDFATRNQLPPEDIIYDPFGVAMDQGAQGNSREALVDRLISEGKTDEQIRVELKRAGFP